MSVSLTAIFAEWLPLRTILESVTRLLCVSRHMAYHGGTNVSGSRSNVSEKVTVPVVFCAWAVGIKVSSAQTQMKASKETFNQRRHQEGLETDSEGSPSNRPVGVCLWRFSWLRRGF